MGGCRCIFRDCPVGTARNPKMHFFRFPVRDTERLLKWAKMSNNADIVHLPLAQLTNKVVCARHFRDDCFMNYKRNKLVATAVPTLDRLKGGYALDYDTIGNIPLMIELPHTNLPHMVAPKGFCCPLELDDDDEVMQANETLLEMEEVLSEDSVLTMQFEDEDVIPEPIEILQKEENPKRLAAVAHKRTALNQSAMNSKKPKILNFIVPENSAQHNVEQKVSFSMELQDNGFKVQQQEGSSTCKLVCNEEIELFEFINVKEVSARTGLAYNKAINTDIKVFNEKGIQVDMEDIAPKNNDREQENLQMQLQRERTRYTNFEQSVTQQVTDLQQALDQAYHQTKILKLQLDQLNDEHIHLKLEHQTLSLGNEQAKSEVATLIAKLNQIKYSYEDLKQKHDTVVELKKQLESKNHALQQQQQQQVSTVSTSKKSSTNQNSIAAIAIGTLPKAQIFNGIKKYLSSSMTAIVRMEMFGSTERAWKPDEKQAALDLFRLGENVYKYFTDEWRFRLPALREVNEWFSDVTAATLDDEDL